MRQFDRQRNQLMKSYGFTCVRQSSHMVWKNAEGQMVTTSKTPSDVNALKRIKQQLKRLCGT